VVFFKYMLTGPEFGKQQGSLKEHLPAFFITTSADKKRCISGNLDVSVMRRYLEVFQHGSFYIRKRAFGIFLLSCNQEGVG